MQKYYLVARNTFDETFTYRLNFTMWRVRELIRLLTVFFLWDAIIPAKGSILGYNQEQMLTYIIGTQLASSIVFSSRSYGVGEEINNGNLSNFLIKPINYFAYWFSKDLGDKIMNIVFAVIEVSLIIFFFHPHIFIQTNPIIIILASISAIIGMTLYFFFNFLLGAIGFWSPEVWAPRFIFSILLSFFAGQLFPLDILPKNIFNVFSFLPFTYLLYFPVKIYLGQISIGEMVSGIFISLFWLLATYLFTRFIWSTGLKNYSAQGR